MTASVGASDCRFGQTDLNATAAAPTTPEELSLSAISLEALMLRNEKKVALNKPHPNLFFVLEASC